METNALISTFSHGHWVRIWRALGGCGQWVNGQWVGSGYGWWYGWWVGV